METNHVFASSYFLYQYNKLYFNYFLKIINTKIFHVTCIMAFDNFDQKNGKYI